MSSGHLFNASLVNNNEETTFTWGLTNSSIFSIMFVDESGFLNRANWLNNQWFKIYSAPKEPCDNYGHCGAFGICDPYGTAGAFECSCLPGFQPKNPNDWNLKDGTGGCVRNPGALTCRDSEGFVKIANAKVPDTSVARVDMSLDLGACRLNCLGNCSCMAYALANESSGVGCTAWYGDLVDTRVFTDGGLDLFVRVDAATFAQYNKSTKKFLAKKGMVAVLVISLAVLFGVVISILYWLFTRKRKGRQRQPGLIEDNSAVSVPFGDSLPSIDVNEIISATENFSLANKLGQGGFGSVYKGQLASGQEIAVKRLSKTSRQGTEEFKNEVKLISKLQHKNLVKLYGCCVHREEKMLVYEFLPNRSLDFFIFDRTRRSLLDWKKRFEIIMGIARGLLYLHQDSRLKIIHRDLKPSNVLLDAAMNPKISDFGMAKIFGDDQTEANTNRVVGTYGYMSPEYAMEGLYSVKSDVFSYGVLMLEIISGRKNTDYYDEGPSQNLIGHVWELWREGTVLDIADTLLGQTYPPHEVRKCIQLFLYRGEKRVWRGGPWTGIRWSGVPEMTRSYLFSVQFVNNKSEVSIAYGVINASIISIMAVDESGTVTRSTWNGRDPKYRDKSPLANNGIQALLIVSIAVTLFLLIFLLYCCIRRKRKVSVDGDRHSKLWSTFTSPTYLGSSLFSKDLEGTNSDLPLFDLSVIVAATHNFSDDNKLGEGGFGSVYKGVINDGKEIAVKRLSQYSGQGIDEFKNEVALIVKLQHRNLVRILGCCIQAREKMLVYEYLPNKSLDSFIFDATKRSLLEWPTRYNIICGIARGILYLHQDSRLKIIHRDLKASNVLLDASMNPKISDFGMARIFGVDQNEANTNRVVGTYGYMSPEYAMHGLFSVKSDVYSFGVLLLEVITGTKNSSFYQESNPTHLVGHVWDLWKEGRALEIVDLTLGDSYLDHQVLRCIEIGLLCVQESAADRPTMSDVVFMLNNETTLPSPNKPAFILKASAYSSGDPSTSGGANSVNDMTVTMLQAR
ncbi:hypothetical protein Tsubulata_041998 [Turnera subulata]|uniref:non-specific serine/threonine protein kinase n=1 Tax=Turnera subulata TaxID=218843 RepID=A0A9Q0JRJ8_9ROSI|nr:hypothetical protein Tsubulata_041998 [Turnera subulata]